MPITRWFGARAPALAVAPPITARARDASFAAAVSDMPVAGRGSALPLDPSLRETLATVGVPPQELVRECGLGAAHEAIAGIGSAATALAIGLTARLSPVVLVSASAIGLATRIDPGAACGVERSCAARF